MRLSNLEREAIKQLIRARDPGAEILLFGSRTDDHLKGGDIDLLVISEKLVFSDKIELLLALKERLGDQKIDLLIHNRASVQSDPFLTKIKENSKLV